MKWMAGLIVVAGRCLGVWQFFQYWENFMGKAPKPALAAPAPVEVSGEQLPGLPDALQGPLQTAEQHGATALREFLAAHGNAIKDPRRAWIELDYVVLAGANDPGEARRVFARVKGRLTPASPVYNRLKQLAKTYE